jgi:hypothetical protein
VRLVARAVARRTRSPSPVLERDISFDAGLPDDVRRAAERETAGNLSAWLAEAALLTVPAPDT